MYYDIARNRTGTVFKNNFQKESGKLWGQWVFNSFVAIADEPFSATMRSFSNIIEYLESWEREFSKSSRIFEKLFTVTENGFLR